MWIGDYTFSRSFSDILRSNSENAVRVQKFSSEGQIREVYFGLNQVHFKIAEMNFKLRNRRCRKSSEFGICTQKIQIM